MWPCFCGVFLARFPGFSRFYLLSPVPFCSFFTPSAVYMHVPRVPAVPPRASQPFPQFERAAGFTGFTLTPLTPRPRPPTATHPAAGQSRDAHVAITHRLGRDWPRPATPLTLIGYVLPPARPLWISFLCFFFFPGALSWSQSAGSGSALRPKLQPLFTELPPTRSPLLRPLFLIVNSASLLSGQSARTDGSFPETWNVRTARYRPGLQNLRVRGPVPRDGAVLQPRSGCFGSAGLGSAGLCWRCLLVYLRSQWTQSLLCVCARAWAVPTVASLQCIAHRCRNFTDVFFVLVQLMLSVSCRRLISRTGLTDLIDFDVFERLSASLCISLFLC